ncbi:hypothetical protein SE15_13325 [Thermanaerothrix daxensis]|uniref:Uncharacterized protein n=1 Tax=Thermanaerothrix daxensis TaxID=869279 RepID=A0A0P6XZV3_9CHLR|nr:DUF6062 family protein [Thermanaerothrix daxensis]KPL82081.1 hypothetical protein SE15_13325 [Thermanaerothrix daxensis]
MSFLSAVFDLKTLLNQPGCPVCKIYDRAAWRYVESLHWENINDPATRQTFLAAWGYCPAHTRLVAQVEQAMFNDWLGTNILYESLSLYVRQELARVLEHLPRLERPRGRLVRFLRRLRTPRRSPASPPACPICTTAESSARNALAGLLEALEHQAEDWQPLYRESDGLCLRHLRLALTLAETYPQAVRFVLQTRLARLDAQIAAMGEYIRKHAWEYRNEPMSEAEQRAWQENLAFFSGYAPSDLLHRKPG